MNLAEDQENLFEQGFIPQAALLTATHNTDNLTFKAKVGSTPERTIVYGAAAKILHSSVTVKPKFSEDGATSLGVTWEPNADLKLKALSKFAAKGGAIENHEQSIGAEFQLANGWLALSLDKNFDFNVKGKLGKEEYGFAVDSTLSLKSATLQPFDLATWYKQSKTKTVLKLEGVDLQKQNYGVLGASLYLEATASTKIASLVKLGLNDNSTTIEVAGEHTLTPSTTLKAKAHSKGIVSGAWIEALRPGITLSLSTSINSLKVFKSGLADAGLGFRLDFSA
mmetsp:Transcript_26311/g.47163  ORF Transcript_26311/g.47163 Transcript_26311/m.47163 type:complete len:281 (+) Transcript_26311:2992-3834(+)